ncbi:MAG: M23 family metallopeptidase [Vampirovibrio sp.]|nr:M23 family metallopeptidase [Vampirovibrio sp.]
MRFQVPHSSTSPSSNNYNSFDLLQGIDEQPSYMFRRPFQKFRHRVRFGIGGNASIAGLIIISLFCFYTHTAFTAMNPANAAPSPSDTSLVANHTNGIVGKAELTLEATLDDLGALYRRQEGSNQVVDIAADSKFSAYRTKEDRSAWEKVYGFDFSSAKKHKPFTQLKRPMKHYVLTSGYGMRHKRFHHGVDFAAPIGTAITASEFGKVTFAGWEGGYGRTVIIDHGHGIKTRYAHLGKVLVKKGQWVECSAKVGTVGMTGRSTGPHLHYEVMANNRSVNPMRYFRG